MTDEGLRTSAPTGKAGRPRKVPPPEPKIKLEIGVPFPTGPYRGPQYPFMDMSRGQSFFVPKDFERPNDELKALHSRMASRCYKESKSREKDGVLYRVRIWTAPDGTQGVRVWRLK